MAMNSALYVGSVAHRRLRPKSHRLRYRVFSLLLDLDELPALEKTLRLFSIGRFNLFGFCPQDHLFAKSGDLRGEVEAILRGAGMAVDGGAIRLLTMPRILGYGFNPLSIFFCYRAMARCRRSSMRSTTLSASVTAICFRSMETAGVLAHACSKEFYVSPFLPMDMAYAFRIKPPDDAYSISISVADEDGDMLVATQHLKRRDARRSRTGAASSSRIRC